MKFLGLIVYWIKIQPWNASLSPAFRLKSTLLESRYSRNNVDQFLKYLEKREASQKSLGFSVFRFWIRIDRTCQYDGYTGSFSRME